MGKLGGNTQMRESFCPLSSSRPVTEPVCKTGMPPTIPPGHWKLPPPPHPRLLIPKNKELLPSISNLG